MNLNSSSISFFRGHLINVHFPYSWIILYHMVANDFSNQLFANSITWQIPSESKKEPHYREREQNTTSKFIGKARSFRPLTLSLLSHLFWLNSSFQFCVELSNCLSSLPIGMLYRDTDLYIKICFLSKDARCPLLCLRRFLVGGTDRCDSGNLPKMRKKKGGFN